MCEYLATELHLLHDCFATRRDKRIGSHKLIRSLRVVQLSSSIVKRSLLRNCGSKSILKICRVRVQLGERSMISSISIFLRKSYCIILLYFCTRSQYIRNCTYHIYCCNLSIVSQRQVYMTSILNRFFWKMMCCMEVLYFVYSMKNHPLLEYTISSVTPCSKFV